MATHAEAEHHGPPEAHLSSRVDPRVLGMFLFIASEVMLFGAFFTAYFFVRVVNGAPWPQEPFHLPKFVAGPVHTNPRHRAPRMAMHVRQALLHDTEDRSFDLLR